jgi:hypothetical protein
MSRNENTIALVWSGTDIRARTAVGGGNWSKIKTQIYIMYKIIIRK